MKFEPIKDAVNPAAALTGKLPAFFRRLRETDCTHDAVCEGRQAREFFDSLGIKRGDAVVSVAVGTNRQLPLAAIELGVDLTLVTLSEALADSMRSLYGRFDQVFGGKVNIHCGHFGDLQIPSGANLVYLPSVLDDPLCYRPDEIVRNACAVTLSRRGVIAAHFNSIFPRPVEAIRLEADAARAGYTLEFAGTIDSEERAVTHLWRHASISGDE